MDSANSRKRACIRTRRGLDAHASGESDPATARETRAHLKDCEPCAALLEERLRVRAVVRRAVRGVKAPSHLAGAIRAMVRQG
jgi:anti-sigma factor RsiW